MRKALRWDSRNYLPRQPASVAPFTEPLPTCFSDWGGGIKVVGADGGGSRRAVCIALWSQEGDKVNIKKLQSENKKK